MIIRRIGREVVGEVSWTGRVFIVMWGGGGGDIIRQLDTEEGRGKEDII